MRAEEGESKAAAPSKPQIGPKRGSLVSLTTAWRCVRCGRAWRALV